MAPRLILFAGAPEANTLKWDEHHLLNLFDEPIARFAGIEREGIPITPGLTRVESQVPAWRSIPLERQPLETGLTLCVDENQFVTRVPPARGWLQNSTFFNTSQIEELIEEEFSQPQTAESFGSIASVSAEQVLSQFYEESYARHTDMTSSQLVPASDVVRTSVSTSFTSSEFSVESFDSPAGQHAAKDIPTVGHIHNLSSIPNAAYLSSIEPQTMTVNLIVGIISIPPPRAIRTRRGANVELTEVLVGDETKSGFGINFWLRASDSRVHPESETAPGQGQSEMGRVLRGLRPQDVILLKNVALSSFRNKVYGQSLRKEVTKVHLLYRNRLDKTDVGGVYRRADLEMGVGKGPQVEKTRSVREWVLRFVGIGAGGGGSYGKGKGKAKEIVEILPDDTQ